MLEMYNFSLPSFGEGGGRKDSKITCNYLLKHRLESHISCTLGKVRKSLFSIVTLMKRIQERADLFSIYVLLICISYFNGTHIAITLSWLLFY